MSVASVMSAISQGGFGVQVSTEYNASSVSKVFYTAQRPMYIYRAELRVEVAGTNGAAVTAQLVRVPSGTAVASGTELLTTAFNLKGTAATNQLGDLVTSSALLGLGQGDSLGIVFTGTLTSATGVLTVLLAPYGTTVYRSSY